ncbi:MAG: type II toxin-antitoxin system VapC family toxin [Reyranella sp.]|uniref:type II toxin-antitoxin system VapC family toxin n=1 Tax=Reyranella sp. TaxID=1929291 RepID=UPI001AC69910|nr:type II toxin-antitoxin system VapC family toxin [Reyranella sp.]MBN9088739.1 type II toxin-antitoxin system VapC family toxin [Reyranella sp.]
MALTHLLDTDICIEALRRRSEPLLRHLRRHVPGEVGVSAISEAELAFGALKSAAPERNAAAAAAFLRPFVVLEFERGFVPVYATLRLDLERAGTRIGALDLMIAAQAVALGLMVVTNNLREFRRVPGLRVENWLV